MRIDPPVQQITWTGRPVRLPQRYCGGARFAQQFIRKNLESFQCGRHPTEKIRSGLLNKQYLATLDWSSTLDLFTLTDAASFTAALHQEIDFELGLVKEMHPFLLSAKANADDNPTWNEAMNEPNKHGYWEACKQEISTLLKKDI